MLEEALQVSLLQIPDNNKEKVWGQRVWVATPTTLQNATQHVQVPQVVAAP